MKLPDFAKAFANVQRWQIIVGGISVVLMCIAGWSHEHDARVRDAALFAEHDKAAQQRINIADAYAKAASAKVVHDSVRVTKTVRKLDTLWKDLIPEQFLNNDDTIKAISNLPVLRRATDSAIAACSDFQLSCAEYRRRSDSLIYALRSQNSLIRDQLQTVTPGKSQTVLRWAERIVIAGVAFKIGRLAR